MRTRIDYKVHVRGRITSERIEQFASRDWVSIDVWFPQVF